MCDMQKKVDGIKALPMSRGQQAVELVRLGMSKTEAAKAIGISRQRVCQESVRQGLRGLTEAGRRAMAIKAGAVPAERRRAWVRKAAAEYRATAGIPDPLLLLRMHTVDGLTFAEIASRYALTRSQVAGYVSRARKDASTYHRSR